MRDCSCSASGWRSPAGHCEAWTCSWPNQGRLLELGRPARREPRGRAAALRAAPHLGVRTGPPPAPALTSGRLAVGRPAPRAGRLRRPAAQTSCTMLVADRLHAGDDRLVEHQCLGCDDSVSVVGHRRAPVQPVPLRERLAHAAAEGLVVRPGQEPVRQPGVDRLVGHLGRLSSMCAGPVRGRPGRWLGRALQDPRCRRWPTVERARAAAAPPSPGSRNDRHPAVAVVRCRRRGRARVDDLGRRAATRPHDADPGAAVAGAPGAQDGRRRRRRRHDAAGVRRARPAAACSSTSTATR